jgi:diketogulonate reductase-like aldo/keto reductase
MLLHRRKMIQLSALAALGGISGFGTKNQAASVAATHKYAGTILKRKIPVSGELIPAIGLGTWQTFDTGNDTEELNALKQVLKSLVANGASVIDSSPMYGNSETVVGNLSAELNIRKKLFLATKVWTSGREAGIEQMNHSFKKMQTELIDLMQVHNLIDASTHIKTLKDWKEKGKIRYWGLTHYVSDAYPEMMRLIKKDKPDFIQFNYNISSREAENVLLPMAKDNGIAVIINRPFEEGALFATVKGKTVPPWASEYGIKSWGQFFLKFILSHPAVSCVIPGTSKVKHMEDNLGAAFGNLPDEAGRRKMIQYFKTI